MEIPPLCTLLARKKPENTLLPIKPEIAHNILYITEDKHVTRKHILERYESMRA